MNLRRPSLIYSWPADEVSADDDRLYELADRSIWLSPEYLKARAEVAEFFAVETGNKEAAAAKRVVKFMEARRLDDEEKIIYQPAQFAIAAEHRAFVPLAETLKQRLDALCACSEGMMGEASSLMEASGREDWLDYCIVDGEKMGHVDYLISRLADNSIDVAWIACAAMVINFLVDDTGRGDAFNFIAGGEFGEADSDNFSKYSVNMKYCAKKISSEWVGRVSSAEKLSGTFEYAGRFVKGHLSKEVCGVCEDISGKVYDDIAQGSIILSAGQILGYIDENSSAIEEAAGLK